MTPGGRHCLYHPAQPLAELLPIGQLRHHPRDAGIAGKPSYIGQVVQGGYAGETARAGNLNPVVKDRRADMFAKVAVTPVQHGIVKKTSCAGQGMTTVQNTAHRIVVRKSQSKPIINNRNDVQLRFTHHFEQHSGNTTAIYAQTCLSVAGRFCGYCGALPYDSI